MLKLTYQLLTKCDPNIAPLRGISALDLFDQTSVPWTRATLAPNTMLICLMAFRAPMS